MDFPQHNIKAAVRLRPMIFCVEHNRHELDKGAKLIVKALDSTNIAVVHPEDSLDTQNFGVSHFYWSFDGYLELQDGSYTADFKHPNGTKYCDQKRVFDNFGKEMVQNAWNGYNSTLISCGESGSGKSWTLFGHGANRGFIPLLASDLFRSIRDKEKGAQAQQMGNSFMTEVKMTMMEIQDDDKVRDLLAGMNSSTKFKQSIKVREHPKRGFYVEGLRSVLISTAEEIQIRIDEGMYNRALQCTNLNLVSSNASVVVGLSLLQKYRNSKGDEMIMSSLIDFYDVAESSLSENWVNSPFTTTSGSSSNKPFSFLEKVVGMPEIREEVPSEIQVNKSNVLFKLLHRALFGNSITYVVGCLSPTNFSYNSSIKLLTLVDKVQRLNTNPIINEELSTKLTRELKIENEHLRKMLSSNDFEKNEFFAWTEKAQQFINTDKDEFKRQIIDDLKSQIKDNEKEIKTLTMSHEERIKQSKMDRGTNEIVTAAKKLENDKKYSAYIYNLNQDSQLTGKVVHILPNGNIEFGSQKRKDQPFLTILGPGIRECHGVISVSTKDNKVTLRALAPDSNILLNGDKLVYESPVFNNDRITLGGNQVWIFQNPRDPWADKALGAKLTYTFTQEEIAMKSPFYTKLCEQSPINLSFRNDILQFTHLISDANAMSSDLEKDVQFEPVVVSETNKSLLEFHELVEESIDEASDSYTSKHLVIKVIHTKDDMEYMWTKEKFLQRYLQMKSLYVQIQEEGMINIPANTEEDPFMENTDTAEMPIGCSFISLKPLSYLLEFQQAAPISDFLTRQSVGSVKVEISPCNDFFEKLDDSKIFLTHPHEQLGNSLHFILKLGSVDLSNKYKDIYAKYKFDQDSFILSTGKLDTKQSSYLLGSSSSPYKYERRVSIDTVTQKLLDYLENDFLVLSFFGKLRPKKSSNLFAKLESNQSMSNTATAPGGSGSLYHLKDYQRQVADLTILRKCEDRMQRKLNTLLKLLETTKEISHNSDSSIPIDYVKKLLDSRHYDTSVEIIAEAAEHLKPSETPPEVPKLSTYQKVSEVCIIS